MKSRILSKVLLVFISLISCITSVFATDIPNLYLNGELKNTQIVLKDSNTLVPLRFCSEELQSIVNWNKDTQEIIITKGTDKVVFTIGSLEYTHNGEVKKLLVAPELIDGTTYVPFRPLVEALDGIVLYNNENKFINIYDTDSEAYSVYKSLNSNDITTKRFAMLEVPRVSNIPSIDATVHYYIFPLENPNANYFLEYQGTWEGEPLVSLKYYSIVDGVAINTWGRQVKQNKSFPIDSHPLFKLIGNASSKDKIEWGIWPAPSDLNFLMFLQDVKSPGVFYLNNIWTEWFLLPTEEIDEKAINPFSNKAIILFEVNQKVMLEKYRSDTTSIQ